MTEFELMITFTIISKAVTKNDEILKFTMRTRYSTKKSCISISQHCMLKATFFLWEHLHLSRNIPQENVYRIFQIPYKQFTTAYEKQL